MKYIFLFLGLLWSIVTHAADLDVGACDTAHNSNACYEELEKAALQKYPSIFIKDGYSLVINSRNGRTIKFTGNNPSDVASEENVREYMTLGILEPSDFVVVYEGFYEGNSMYLVSVASGSKYKIDGDPVLSPDHARILVYSMDIDANYNRNFLDIYRIDGGELKREMHVDGETERGTIWGPSNVTWDGNTIIRFDKTSHGQNGDYTYEPREIVLKNGKWVINTPLSDDSKAH